MASLSLWQYNEITGIWNHMRSVHPDTAENWLKIFQKDNPRAAFRISKYQPKKMPIWDSENRRYK